MTLGLFLNEWRIKIIRNELHKLLNISVCRVVADDSLSVPLTLSVVGVLNGLLILAFVIARVRQKQRY